MPATYEPIATTTLGTAAASIDFTSISASYTDLRLVLVAKNATNSSNPNLTVNNDTGTNYSVTRLFGNGTTVTSNRNASITSVGLNDGYNLSTAQWQTFFVDFFSYAGSSYKTFLINSNQDENGAGEVGRYVGMWRSTSTITSVKMTVSAGTFAIGTTATLYGIKNA
jgi:hypothetical protein